MNPTFDALGLSAPFLRAIRASGYAQPTPIQRAAIPPALTGRDILGCAQTGTGKTAAFALPLLQRLDATVGDEPTLRALIVTPTRELAAQIGESVATYGQFIDLWHTVVFGGVSDRPQIRELQRGVDLLVATPGRLLDLMNRGAVSLEHVEMFVLDEADRMLDMGFLPDVRRIVAALPRKRQTLFFSATMPPAIRELAHTLLHDPVSASVARVSEPIETVEQRVYFVDKDNKRNLLWDLVRAPEAERTVVFSRTKHGANRIAKLLETRGIKVGAIHGNKSQSARTRVLDEFRTGKLAVVVATDLAARGIDIEGITHVINFDLPNVPETYVHRIGRTGRAGASGIALSFCDDEERGFLRDIEKLIGRSIPRVEDHAYRSEGGKRPHVTSASQDVRPSAAGSRPGASKPAASAGRGRGRGRPMAPSKRSD